MLSAASQIRKTQPDLHLVEKAQHPGVAHEGIVPSLFGIRALCAMFVVFAHTTNSRAFAPYADILHQYLPYIPAKFGVRVFFVLSGFIITLTLLREEKRERQVSLKNFYIRRFFRLAPAAMVFLMLVPLLGLNRGELHPMDGWWTALTYTQAIATYFFEPAWSYQHFWSLSVEEFFYLLWPIAFVSLTRKQRVTALGATILLVPIIRGMTRVFSRFPGYMIVEHLDLLAMGCLAAIIFFDHELRMRPFFEKHGRKVMVVSALAITSILYGDYSLRWAIFRVPFSYSIEAIALSLIVLSTILREKSFSHRLLNWKPLVTVGVMSYSLYIWQQVFVGPFASMVPGSPIAWWRAFPLNEFLLIATTYLSYRLVESPFQRLGHRLTAKSR